MVERFFPLPRRHPPDAAQHHPEPLGRAELGGRPHRPSSACPTAAGSVVELEARRRRSAGSAASPGPPRPAGRPRRRGTAARAARAVPLPQRRAHGEDRAGKAHQVPERGEDPGATTSRRATSRSIRPRRPVLPPEPGRVGMPGLAGLPSSARRRPAQHRHDAAEAHAAEGEREDRERTPPAPSRAGATAAEQPAPPRTRRPPRTAAGTAPRSRSRVRVEPTAAAGVADARRSSTGVSVRPPHSVHEPSYSAARRGPAGGARAARVQALVPEPQVATTGRAGSMPAALEPPPERVGREQRAVGARPAQRRQAPAARECGRREARRAARARAPANRPAGRMSTTCSRPCSRLARIVARSRTAPRSEPRREAGGRQHAPRPARAAAPRAATCPSPPSSTATRSWPNTRKVHHARAALMFVAGAVVDHEVVLVAQAQRGHRRANASGRGSMCGRGSRGR